MEHIIFFLKIIQERKKKHSPLQPIYLSLILQVLVFQDCPNLMKLLISHISTQTHSELRESYGSSLFKVDMLLLLGMPPTTSSAGLLPPPLKVKGVKTNSGKIIEWQHLIKGKYEDGGASPPARLGASVDLEKRNLDPVNSICSTALHLRKYSSSFSAFCAPKKVQWLQFSAACHLPTNLVVEQGAWVLTGGPSDKQRMNIRVSGLWAPAQADFISD